MITLNGVDWKLKFVNPYDSNLFRNDGSLTVGMCDSNLRTIFINENLGGDFLRKVLCHELTHAAMFSYGIMLTNDQEELVANVLSTYGNEIIDKTNLIFSKIRG